MEEQKTDVGDKKGDGEEKEIELPENYFSYQIGFLRFLGIEVIIKDESFFYRIYSFFMLAFTASFVFSECVELCFHRDFNTLVIVCNYAISHFLGMIKVVVFYTNRKKIGDLMTSLHEGVFIPDTTRAGIFERKVIKDTLFTCGWQMVTYGLTIVVVLSLGMSNSVFIRFVELQEKWKLPFVPISLFSHMTRSPRWEMGFLFQAFGIIMISLCVYTIDISVVGVIAQMGAQIRILERCVRNYEERAQKRIKKSEDEERIRAETLFDTIDHHLNIIERVETVEALCSFLALCVFLANMILLCLLMYHTSLMAIRIVAFVQYLDYCFLIAIQIFLYHVFWAILCFSYQYVKLDGRTMAIKSVAFIQYLDYCFLIAIQIFLYCYWGNELVLANERLALGAAQSYNPYASVNRSKALKLLMIRSQRPLFLTAGKFAPLTLETYKGIIKGSFSYFMVLRQVNRGEEEEM